MIVDFLIYFLKRIDKGERVVSYDSRAVGNVILDIARQKGIGLTLMQLTKLVYIAHGWKLAFDGAPLTQDSVEAWKYGPVYPSLYDSLKHFGGNIITSRSVDPYTGTKFMCKLDDEDIKLLEHVVEGYGNMHAYRLSDITHQPNTPWRTATELGGYYARIDDNLIKKHFDLLKVKRMQALDDARI